MRDSFSKSSLQESVTVGAHTHPQSEITNLVTDLAGKQPLDSDLTTIAGLTATTDSFIQSKSSAWASRTVAQVKTDLGLTGTNSGDQTSIVGITGTKAQFNTAVSDGDILFVGDVTQYTTEEAQDAVGAMVDATLTYVDGTPLLQRAALTGDVTASAGSNTTALAAGSASVLNSGTLPAGRMPALTGDVTTTIGTVAATIAADAVTYAKMQNVSAISKLLGRGSAAGAGDPEEITLGTNLSMSGTTLNASGGGGAASITQATATVPYDTRDALVAITDAAVTAASKIMLCLGHYLQTDTNDPSDAVFSVEDVGTGTFNVRARAMGRESIGGPFKLNYILG